MAVTRAEIAAALGTTEEALLALLRTESSAIQGKIAAVNAERDKVLLEFEATLGDLHAALTEAQKREDEALGKV